MGSGLRGLSPSPRRNPAFVTAVAVVAAQADGGGPQTAAGAKHLERTIVVRPLFAPRNLALRAHE